MAIEIKAWQILKDKLEPLENTLAGEGYKELDLENWIRTNPEVIGSDINIIGEKIRCDAGEIDFLAIDRSGNVMVIELKREKLSRDALAQAIDYASSISYWDIDDLNNICLEKNKKSLAEFLSKVIDEEDLEENINIIQPKIILIGFSIDESLERMVEWLSNNFDFPINAICLKFIKTSNGDECILRTSIIPDEVVEEKTEKKRKLERSDEPGTYQDEELKNKLVAYLKKSGKVNEVVKIILRLGLEKPIVKREDIKKEINFDLNLSALGMQLRTPWRDYLRQVISYERMGGITDNFKIENKYKDLIKEVLEEVQKNK